MMTKKKEQYQEHLSQTAGDYTVKKRRVLDNVAKVVTLILAVMIWMYVMATNMVEKPVVLTVKEKNGLDFTDRITLDIENSSVLVKGDAAVVEALQQLQLEDFSAKTLQDEDEDGKVEITLFLKEDSAPKGVTSILKPNGNAFSGGKVKVNATVQVGHSHVLEIPKRFITVGTVSNSDSNAAQMIKYELAQETLTVKIRCLSSDEDHNFFNQLKTYLSAPETIPQESIFSVYAHIPEEKPDLDKVPVTISFGVPYNGKMYEVFELDENGEVLPYTVKVKKVEKNEQTDKTSAPAESEVTD